MQEVGRQELFYDLLGLDLHGVVVFGVLQVFVGGELPQPIRRLTIECPILPLLLLRHLKQKRFMPPGRLTLRMFQQHLRLHIQLLPTFQPLNIFLIPALRPIKIGICTLTIHDIPPEPRLQSVLDEDTIVAFADPRLVDCCGLAGVLHSIGPVDEE